MYTTNIGIMAFSDFLFSFYGGCFSFFIQWLSIRVFGRRVRAIAHLAFCRLDTPKQVLLQRTQV